MAHLFDPLRLRGLSTRNRVWLAPMCQYAVDRADGVPTEWHLVHLGARAAGGFGMVVAEATAVVPEGRITPNDTGLWNDQQASGWQPITSFIHAQGAASAVQLAHAGRKASTRRGFPGEPSGVLEPGSGGWQPVAPSPEAFPELSRPHELTLTEIADVVSAFGAAARRAVGAGFDTIEIHAAHGYLLHEFLSPLSNHRTDRYGGDFEGRTRLVLEVIDAIRAELPDSAPLLLRISATDWVEGGWDAEQSTELARLAGERGVDLVDVSSGGNVTGVTIPLVPGYQVPLAAQVRTAGVPVGAVGLITEPVQADDIIASDQADVVLIGRAALREPGWPQRAAHALGIEAPELYPPNYSRAIWR